MIKEDSKLVIEFRKRQPDNSFGNDVGDVFPKRELPTDATAEESRNCKRDFVQGLVGSAPLYNPMSTSMEDQSYGFPVEESTSSMP